MSGKQRKFLTIMIIPHSGQAVVSWKIPAFLLKAVKYFCFGIIMTGIAFGFIYHDMRTDIAKTRALQQENVKQQQQLKQFAQQANKIQQELTSLRQLDTQVRGMFHLQKQNDASPQIQRKQVTSISSRAATVRQTALNFDNIGQEGLVEGHYIPEGENIAELTSQLAVEFTELPDEIETCRQSMHEVRDTIIYQRAKLAATPSIMPASGRITSDFGYRKHPIYHRIIFHDGIDIAAPRGTAVRAVADGVVIFAGRKSGYGNTIMINHGFGYVTLYGHNSQLMVKDGQKVKKGEVIAKVGSTGSSTGPHLHYEVHVNGALKNPAKYF